MSALPLPEPETIDGAGWLYPADLDWQTNALCAQVDPELFFPEQGGVSPAARRTCMSCEVRVQCLEYALTNREAYGVWGATTPQQRARILRDTRGR